MGDNGDINFILNLRKFLRQKCLRDIAENYHLENLTEYNYIYAYFESGAVGILRYWLAHPEDGKSAEDIAYLIENIFLQGAGYFVAAVENGEV